MQNENTRATVKLKYPKVSTVKEETVNVQTLIRDNKHLMEHMSFLRKKIEDQNKQIELYTELITTMDEKIQHRTPVQHHTLVHLLDIGKINLN